MSVHPQRTIPSQQNGPRTNTMYHSHIFKAPNYMIVTQCQYRFYEGIAETPTSTTKRVIKSLKTHPPPPPPSPFKFHMT